MSSETKIITLDNIVPVNHKFSCLVLKAISPWFYKSEPITIDEFSVFPLVSLDLKDWRIPMGTFFSEKFSGKRMLILKTSPASEPMLLNGEGESNQRHLTDFLYCLLLTGYFRIHAGLYLHGGSTESDLSIRSLAVPFNDSFMLDGINEITITKDQTEKAVKLYRQIQKIRSANDRFERLKRGLIALEMGVHFNDWIFRIHNFVRTLDSFLYLQMPGKLMFKRRCQLVIGISDENETMLDEIYEIRNKSEHLHDWRDAINPEDEAGCRFLTAERCLQTWHLMSNLVVNFLMDEDTFQCFDNDDHIKKFWVDVESGERSVTHLKFEMGSLTIDRERLEQTVNESLAE